MQPLSIVHRTPAYLRIRYFTLNPYFFLKLQTHKKNNLYFFWSCGFFEVAPFQPFCSDHVSLTGYFWSLTHTAAYSCHVTLQFTDKPSYCGDGGACWINGDYFKNRGWKMSRRYKKEAERHENRSSSWLVEAFIPRFQMKEIIYVAILCSEIRSLLLVRGMWACVHPCASMEYEYFWQFACIVRWRISATCEKKKKKILRRR